VTVAEHYCDALSNVNIFSSVRPILRNNTDPVIVVATRVCTVVSYSKLVTLPVGCMPAIKLTPSIEANLRV